MTTYGAIHHCLDKPAYSSHGEAVRALYRGSLRKNTLILGLQPYQCAFHPTHFHLGNTQQERKAA
jgi:hypothetical protein